MLLNCKKNPISSALLETHVAKVNLVYETLMKVKIYWKNGSVNWLQPKIFRFLNMGFFT